MEVWYQELLTGVAKVFTLDELRERAVRPEYITIIQNDDFQQHPQVRDGYLGMLVLNALMRHGVVRRDVKSPQVPAVIVAQALQLDLVSLLGLRTHRRRVVVEDDLGAGPDMYVAVCDLHLVNKVVDPDADLNDLAVEYTKTGHERVYQELENCGLANALSVIGFASRKMGLGTIFSGVRCRAIAEAALHDAINTYEATKGARFTSWLENKVKWAIGDELRQEDVLSRNTRKRLNHMQKYKVRFHELYRSNPTVTQYYEHWVALGYPASEFEKNREWILSGMVVLSLDANIKGTDIKLEHRIPSTFWHLDETFRYRDLGRALRADIRDLPGDGPDIITKFFYHDFSKTDLARLYNTSVFNISYVIKKCTKPKYFKRTQGYLGIPSDSPYESVRARNLELGHRL